MASLTDDNAAMMQIASAWYANSECLVYEELKNGVLVLSPHILSYSDTI